MEDFEGREVSLHYRNNKEPLTSVVSFHKKENWRRGKILFHFDGMES